jgi:hypothetical protein
VRSEVSHAAVVEMGGRETPSETSEPRWPHLRFDFDHLFVVYNCTPTITPPQPLNGSAIFSDHHISQYVSLCLCSPNCNKIRPSWTETEGMFAQQQACETKSYHAIQYLHYGLLKNTAAILLDHRLELSIHRVLTTTQ